MSNLIVGNRKLYEQMPKTKAQSTIVATANSLQANGYAANRILGHNAGSFAAQSTIVATANSLQANGYALHIMQLIVMNLL